MTPNRDPLPRLDPGDMNELGFGSAETSRQRLIESGGKFSSSRHGLPVLSSVPIYELLLRTSWGHFYAMAVGVYFVVAVIFAAIFTALGPGAIAGATGVSLPERFADAFFLSVHTVTTVGYGSLAPATLAANVFVAAEALIGLAGFAVLAALLFARLARPTADIRFSDHAVIAPYHGGEGLMFRVVNAGRGDLVEASVRVIISWLEGVGAERKQRYETLDLELNRIIFFPLHWTVVHPIDEDSPLWGVDAMRLHASHVELLIQLTATSETYAQTVRARHSYVASEILYGTRFTKIIEEEEDGRRRVDIRRINEVEPTT